MKIKKAPRKLYIVGDISHENYLAFALEMDRLESEGSSAITIEICSEGGDTYAGLAFYSRIANSPCLTETIIRGHAMSAASIISAGASNRKMDKDAWLMVHDDTYPLKGTDRTIMANECAHHESMENHWADILARHSSVNTEDWREMSKVTTYLSASECLAFGIIDEVV